MFRYLVSILGGFLILFSTTVNSPALARKLVIFTSHDYISRNYEIQHFVDTLTLKEGQLELPLTMAIYNGSPETPSYKWFRVFINGVIVASEHDLNGKETGSKDVTGIIQGSDSQMQIEAGGVPGASLWFTLSTEMMELTGVEPRQATPGQQLKITGANIPASPDLLSVTIGGQPVNVLSASIDSIVVRLPETASPGTAEIEVRSKKQVANPVSVMVVSRPVPEILGIDCWMAPPGGTINLSGRNFSVNAVENKVYFGKVEAQVNSASSTQLAVVVPNWPYGPSQLNIPITVVVNGMRSSNSYPFDIGPSYHGDIPQFGHD